MTTYDAVVLADTPTAFWKLTDGSGSTAADSSGNSHDGTATSVTFGETSPALPNGMSGTCASFDGTASDISSDSYQGPASGSFSAELWVNQDSLSQSTAFANFITTGNPSSYDAGFQIGVNFGSIAGSSGTGSSNVSVSDGSLEASGWTHLVLTFDGSDATLYVNGVAGTPESASAYASATDSIHIGSVFGTGNFFTGFLARAAIYDYALTSTQVSDHYAAGLGIYVVQTQDGNSGSQTFDAEVAEHNAVVLIPIMYGGTDVTSSNVKLGGSTVTGTTLLQHVTDTSVCSHDIWILPDCPAGQTTVTFDVSAALDSVFLYEIAGLGPNPTADQVVSAHRSFTDSSAIIGAGPTSPTVYENEIAITASAAYNGGVDTEPDVWISPPRSDSDHGWSGYQVFSSSGATPSFAFINNEAWTAGIVTLAPAPSGVSASGAITLKKMVLSGASAEKAVVTGAITLKKMVLSAEGDAVSEIVVVQEASNASDFPSPITAHNSILFWTTSYGNDGQTSPPPTVDGSVYAGTVKLWEGQSVYDANALYMGLFLIPDVTEATPTLAQAGVTNATGTLGWHAWELQGAASVLDAVVTVMVRENTADTGEISIGPSGETSFAHELVFLLYAQEFSGPPPPPVPDWSTNQANVSGYYYSAWKDSGASAGVTFSADMGAGSDGWVGVILAIPRASDVAPGSVSGAITLKKMVLSASVLKDASYLLLDMPVYAGELGSDSSSYTLGVQFKSSEPATLTAINFYSAIGAGAIPFSIDLFAVSDGSLVHSEVASWSGEAGSGWIRAEFSSPPSLEPGVDYKASVTTPSGANWYSFTSNYWTTGPGASGIVNGPLSAPNSDGADYGQDSYAVISGYPNQTYQGDNYWVNPEVVVGSPGAIVSGALSLKKMVLSVAPPAESYSVFQTRDMSYGQQSYDNSGTFDLGLQFTITESGYQLSGYYWYLTIDSGTDGTKYSFDLFTTTDGTTGTLVSGSEVTGSGTWTAGAWNYTELETPVLLDADTTYVMRGENSNTSNAYYQFITDYWGDGWPGADGVINGPISVPSGASALNGVQQPFSNPSLSTMPVTGYIDSWYGVDIAVTPVSALPSISGAIKLKKMVLSGVGVAPDIYVIQTMRSDGGTYSATFDDPISEHSTILICATGYTGSSETPESSDPQLDGVSVPDAVQLIPDFWNAACGGTVWMLPDVEAGSPVISLTVENFGSNSENGIFLYEIANLGPNPQLDQFVVSNPHTGDSASFSISPITNRPEFVLGMYIQDGGNPPSGPGDGWNNSGLQGNWGGANNGSGFYQIADTAGAEYSMAWTNDGVVHWSGVILSLMQGGPSASITGAIKLKKMVLAGVSHEKAVITGAIKLKKMVLAGVSHEKAVITGAVKLKKMVISGASQEKAVITGAVKLKKMVLAATVVKKPAITGSIKLKKMVISGASHEKAVITGTIKLKKMRVHGEEAKRKSSNLFVFAPP